jgi:hypothetical protein
MEVGRETPSASHNHAGGQILRCFAMKPNFVSSPSKVGSGYFRMSRSALRFVTSLRLAPAYVHRSESRSRDCTEFGVNPLGM